MSNSCEKSLYFLWSGKKLVHILSTGVREQEVEDWETHQCVPLADGHSSK